SCGRRFARRVCARYGERKKGRIQHGDLDGLDGDRRITSNDRGTERLFATLVAGRQVSRLCARAGKGWPSGCAAVVHVVDGRGRSLSIYLAAARRRQSAVVT